MAVVIADAFTNLRDRPVDLTNCLYPMAAFVGRCILQMRTRFDEEINGAFHTGLVLGPRPAQQ